jgi:hypothetical protein
MFLNFSFVLFTRSLHGSVCEAKLTWYSEGVSESIHEPNFKWSV